MKSLREDGWRHVLQGRTTIEEVLRVTKDERFNGNNTVLADQTQRAVEQPDHSPQSFPPEIARGGE